VSVFSEEIIEGNGMHMQVYGALLTELVWL